MKHPERHELTSNGLLVKLANSHTTQCAYTAHFLNHSFNHIFNDLFGLVWFGLLGFMAYQPL